MKYAIHVIRKHMWNFFYSSLLAKMLFWNHLWCFSCFCTICKVSSWLKLVQVFYRTVDAEQKSAIIVTLTFNFIRILCSGRHLTVYMQKHVPGLSTTFSRLQKGCKEFHEVIPETKIAIILKLPQYFILSKSPRCKDSLFCPNCLRSPNILYCLCRFSSYCISLLCLV